MEEITRFIMLAQSDSSKDIVPVVPPIDDRVKRSAD